MQFKEQNQQQPQRQTAKEVIAANVQHLIEQLEEGEEGDAPTKLLTAFIRKADETALGRLLVETAILLALVSQQEAAKALRDAAEQYKVIVEVIASAVKQEFAAKAKAKVGKRAKPKTAAKPSTAKKNAAPGPHQQPFRRDGSNREEANGRITLVAC